MKLYYSPGACSLAPHIVLCEAGVPHQLVKVDLRRHQLPDGADYYAINPKGGVPAIDIGDGVVLTEGVAVLQYLAERHAPALAPAKGALERARLHEILNYVSSDYAKAYTPLFYLAEGASRADAQRPVIARLGYLESLLADGRAFILGPQFSVADAYVFAVTRWAGDFGIGLDAVPALKAYMARVAARAAVQQALLAEGLTMDGAQG
ncbi:glutathione binding-like protein [Massilia genomosp. 1]|uniref:Glutathione S-transferase n=1 Tax=Massilia genomosp. 1 TaxID=2609280 RepID=A0ABX0N153_9BURK|nr:glutathione binding-like protein [Massilia genomosp. 1]NHZ66093.1 glutathione S-transferase [Massilia genomosp. 1]